MEAEKKAAALKAAALVDKPPHALIAVNIDSKEAELSWLGSWLVYFLVATVEIIISAANTTFNQMHHWSPESSGAPPCHQRAVHCGSGLERRSEGLKCENIL